MKRILNRILPSLRLALVMATFQPVVAQQLAGIVKDAHGDPIATASVYVEGTTLGTLTDATGHYRLDLTPGNHRIAVKMLGYMKQIKSVTVPQTLRLDFILPEEDIEIEETIITSNGKDPAYYIIQQAIDHKKENRLYFDAYQFSSYQKTLIRNKIKMLRELTTKDALRALKVADSLSAVAEQGNGKLALPNDFKPTFQHSGADSSSKSPNGSTLQLPNISDSAGVGDLLALLPMLLQTLRQDTGFQLLRTMGVDSVGGMDLGTLGKMVAPLIGAGLIDSMTKEIAGWVGKLPALLDSIDPGDSSGLRQLLPMLPVVTQALQAPTALANPPKPETPAPAKIPQQAQKPAAGGDESILYLEESLTKSTFGSGNRNKEELISGKTIGDDGKGALLGLVARMVFDFDPYDNMTYFDSIIPQGIVSPISNSAMLYYNYKLLGSKKEQGHKQYKIQVIPKNPQGPTYRGLIYIADSSFAVSSLALLLTKANDISFLDTIEVAKEYVYLSEHQAWVPFGLQARLVMSLGLAGMLDLRLVGESEQLKSDWVINPELPKGFWNNEILRVADSAGSHSEEYWADTRKFDLREEEKQVFDRSDSLRLLHSNPAWQDSMTRVGRKFKLASYLINGYHPKNYRKNRQFDLYAPWTLIGFNPIEGLHVQMHAKETWLRGEHERCALDGVVRYGFANHWFSYQLGFTATLQPRQNGVLTIQGGDMPQEFSQFQQTYPIKEEFYNLFLKRNYYKAYQKQFTHVGYETELVNGLRIHAAADWEWRFGWRNHTDYSFAKQNVEYSPNILVPTHQAAKVTIGVSFKPFNKYWTIDSRKINVGSKWPMLSARYQKGIANILDSDVDFDRVQASLLQNLKFGTAGTTDIYAEAGTFLSQKQVFFPDQFHFLSNQTVFHDPSLHAFQLMNYYGYSTTGSYLQAHASHGFNGLIMSRLPLIKKLRMKEFAEAHYLLTPTGNWLEAGVGLQKGFLHRLINLRVNYHLKLLGNGGSPQRITFSITGVGGFLGK